ncbi:unnamed protein product, partial [Rotaria magnacalcarata]
MSNDTTPSVMPACVEPAVDVLKNINPMKILFSLRNDSTQLGTNIDNNTQVQTSKILNLSNKKLSDQNLRRIAYSLKSNTTLITLNLAGNNFGITGIKYLLIALQSNITLTTLDLQNNKIGDEGIQCLAEFLYDNTTLTTLNLGGNDIEDKGAYHLASAIQHNM